jgi:hypothetical protein
MCATVSTLHSSNSLGILSLLFHDEGGNGLALCERLSLGYHCTHCHLSLQMDVAEIALQLYRYDYVSYIHPPSGDDEVSR